MEDIITDKINYSQLDRIEQEFFQQPSAFHIKRGIEGQRVDQDLNVFLGLFCGCEFNEIALLHEMCHLVEIDEERITLRDWGLRYGRFVEFQTRYYSGFYEKDTPQHIEREIRVHAYQISLMEYLGYKFTPKDICGSCIYLPDSFLAKTIAPELEGSWEGFDGRFAAWFTQESIKLSHIYNIERFKSEWSRRERLILDKQKLIKND